MLLAAVEHRDLLDWVSLALIPFLAVMTPYIVSNLRKVKTNAEEAAYSVRPNGTGHPSITAMLEDVLKSQGAQEASLERMEIKLDDHIDAPGHPQTLIKLEEVKGLLDTFLKNIK